MQIFYLFFNMAQVRRSDRKRSIVNYTESATLDNVGNADSRITFPTRTPCESTALFTIACVRSNVQGDIIRFGVPSDKLKGYFTLRELKQNVDYSVSFTFSEGTFQESEDSLVPVQVQVTGSIGVIVDPSLEELYDAKRYVFNVPDYVVYGYWGSPRDVLKPFSYRQNNGLPKCYASNQRSHVVW